MLHTDVCTESLWSCADNKIKVLWTCGGWKHELAFRLNIHGVTLPLVVSSQTILLGSLGLGSKSAVLIRTWTQYLLHGSSSFRTTRFWSVLLMFLACGKQQRSGQVCGSVHPRRPQVAAQSPRDSEMRRERNVSSHWQSWNNVMLHHIWWVFGVEATCSVWCTNNLCACEIWFIYTVYLISMLDVHNYYRCNYILPPPNLDNNDSKMINL